MPKNGLLHRVLIFHSWYVYYAAGGEGDDVQSSYVLKGNKDKYSSKIKTLIISGGPNIWEDPYKLEGTIIGDQWAIDGTVMKIADANYFVFSRFDNAGQSIWIARMTSPTTISEQAVLTQPTEPWEQTGEAVNEGPHPLYHEDRVFVTYSGSFCATTDYALGLLAYDGEGDPLNQTSWAKTGPLFSSANGNYGTGHNGFFNSPDGTEVWNVYHATTNTTGACDGQRYTMATKVNWKEDGSPDFGQALPLGEVQTGPSGEQ